MERVSLQQRDETEELDLDGDTNMRPLSNTRTRSRRKAIHESSSDDEHHNVPLSDADDSDDDHPLGAGTFNQNTSLETDAHQHNPDEHGPDPDPLAPDLSLSQNSDNPVEDAESRPRDHEDIDSGFSDDNDKRDEDYPPKSAKSVRRSLPLRVRVADAVVTKSGRVSKPPRPISPELHISSRRPRENRPEMPPSREERYRRRSERLYGGEQIPPDSGPQNEGRSPSRSRRRQRSKAALSYDRNRLDDFEDEEELLGKGIEDGAFEHRRNGTTRTRNRVVKMEDLANVRSTRTGVKSNQPNAVPSDTQTPYSLRLRSRSTPNGIGKSGSVKQNGVAYGRSYDDDRLGGEERDGDYRTPDESEIAEELANDEDEDVIAEGVREDVSDEDDFMTRRPSRISTRRNRKARPQRSIPSKRKRPRSRPDREQNSLARETKRSYRTRRTSLRREDFYQESDMSSESSDSSDDDGPPAQRSRPIRRAAPQENAATPKNLTEVDFLKNPMAVLDSGAPSRARHIGRYNRRRSRLRPSGPEPTGSDVDDGPGSNMPPIEPIQVDLDLSWDDIGGLDHHIRALKEMVFLPLMYPEVFEKFHMEAPRGVLFYGPPGTGKTLCARALAASCGSMPDETKPSSVINANKGQAKHPESNGVSPEVDRDQKQNGVEEEHLHVGHETQKSCVSIISNDAPVTKEGSDAMQDRDQEIPQEDAKPFDESETKAELPKQPSAPQTSQFFEKAETVAHQGRVSFKDDVAPPPPPKKKPRVSFFMRNGADCLSKWVGEAERQLRMTFEAAKKHEPAIIFFDEIDGLAPVRSSRQDQIHSSIVSTLLGLMDGLDSRGKIVVIGATNRVDAIDPALRRPGRFDRELIFTLPNQEARKRILSIHTAKWNPPPKPEVVDAVAKMTVGYCGADLKSLCSESAIRALRRRYPQIYDSHEKLLIDVDQVRVSTKDFLAAMKDIVPASHRSARTHARPIPERLFSVLSHPLQSCILILQRIFPQGLGKDAIRQCGLSRSAGNDTGASKEIHDDADIASTSEDEPELDVQAMQDQIANAGKIRRGAGRALSTKQHVLRPRLLLCGQQGLGQAQLGPALLHFCEGCPVHAIDYPSLHADGGARSAEEALISAFREATRSVPSVLYLPHLQLWWESAPQSLRTTLVVALKDLPSDLPVLVLATSETSMSELPGDVTELFGDMHELSVPSEEHRGHMFAPIVKEAQARPRFSNAEVQVRKRRRVMEVLPKAPPPQVKPPTVEEQTQKIQAEDRFIRALRMEMRAFVENLLRDKRFKAFWNPVDPNSAPDYYEIIKTPMDITQIAGRVDSGSYPTVLAMVNDFDIMIKNAIQYNPPNTEVGATILRRAHGLIDIVHAWVDNLNPTLVETCNSIVADRIARAGRKSVALERESAREETDKPAEADANGIQSGEAGTTDACVPQQGVVENTEENVVNPQQTKSKCDAMNVDIREAAEATPSTVEPRTLHSLEAEAVPVHNEVFTAAESAQIAKLEKLVLDVSTGMTVDGLEGLYVRCEKVLHERRRSLDRASAVKALISTVLLARDDPALVGRLVE